MRLSVKDAAQLLQVSEKTIYRWVRGGALPAHRLGDQYRFNRAELMEWATSRRLNVSPELLREPESETATLPTVTEALRIGGIHYRVEGTTKQEVISALATVLPLPEEVDRAYLVAMISAREALASTAIGEGIALPHLRNPALLPLTQALIGLCFLEHPVDFGATDGKAVRTLVVILAPTLRAHLHLLARVSFLLRDPRLRASLSQDMARDAVFALIAKIESELTLSRPKLRSSPKAH